MNLNDKLENHFRMGEELKRALVRLDIFTVRDLLYYFPTRYTDISEINYINTLEEGKTSTILGKISNLETKKGWKTKVAMGKATLSDITGKINIVWFHQPYLAKMIRNGSTVRVTGKVTNHKTYGLTLTNPEISKEDVLPIDIHDSLFENEINHEQYGFPVYRETKGLTSRWIYHTINKIIKSGCLKGIDEPIPEYILEKYKLPRIDKAMIWIHSPKNKDHREAARKRFAFEEVFFIQLARQQDRKKYEQMFSYKLEIPEDDISDFISRFPFTPTNSQKKTIRTILDDMKKDIPMSRLVEGDVGSGKTFVAATIAYAVIKNRPLNKAKDKKQTFGNLQVAYMAPTEVLATQLFENFISYFRHTGIQIGLITGKSCRKFPSKVLSNSDSWTNISKNQLLKWVKNGEVPIVVGTHALISKNVEFKDLGLVIIDEQHRFGTSQRMKLVKKDKNAPHYLSMTATPIPRTLALTIYGDLDLSIMDEMPKGRKPVITEIINEKEREKTYEKIKEELKNGRQLYVICPKIESEEVGEIVSGGLTQADGPSASEKLTRVLSRADRNNFSDLRSVTSEAKRLQKDIFPEYKIDIMHSKMTKNKKEDVMRDFAKHKIDILVSTSVIEVGVNVPNATMIIIEGAERFGLAQLHQLRGRVMRSTHQSYCYLFTSTYAKASADKNAKSKANYRLDAIKTAKSGFELAELDLNLRGAGLLSGDKQWGITDLGMEAIKNVKMVEAARVEALDIVKDDIELENHKNLKKVIQSKNLEKLHFE